MSHWVPLTLADLSAVFNADELSACTQGEFTPYVEETLGDIVAIVREAVAANQANQLSADQELIPRSLRPAALDIAAVRLLKRFALTVTEERKSAAAAAEQRLEAVRRAESPVLNESGALPTAPAHRPAIVAPRPAYGNDGVGFYPVPDQAGRR